MRYWTASPRDTFEMSIFVIEARRRTPRSRKSSQIGTSCFLNPASKAATWSGLTLSTTAIVSIAPTSCLRDSRILGCGLGDCAALTWNWDTSPRRHPAAVQRPGSQREEPHDDLHGECRRSGCPA